MLGRLLLIPADRTAGSFRTFRSGHIFAPSSGLFGLARRVSANPVTLLWLGFPLDLLEVSRTISVQSLRCAVTRRIPGWSRGSSMSMQNKPQMVEAVMFFSERGICKQMMFPEFEACLLYTSPSPRD